ncbi:MAG: nucleotide-binding protein [Candidatus Heimdallarchaeota archaeon]
MTYTIAISGKGGTGKTTFAGLLIDCLTKLGEQPVLAVDADPNANLHDVLGISYSKTIADIREEPLKRIPDYPSMPKERLVEFLLHQTLQETDNYDLLVMGRPEGKRCYCFVNNLLRKHLDVISNRYEFVVIDNEAGMEHLSRMTTRDVDLLCLVSDPTKRGLETAARIQQLVEELEIVVKQQVLIVNKLTDEKREQMLAYAQSLGFEDVILLPESQEIKELDVLGQPLVLISDENPLRIILQRFACCLEQRGAIVHFDNFCKKTPIGGKL